VYILIDNRDRTGWDGGEAKIFQQCAINPVNRGFGLESEEILGDDIGTAKSEDFSETEIVIHLRAF